MRVRTPVAIALIFAGCSKAAPVPSAEPAPTTPEAAQTPQAPSDMPRLKPPAPRPTAIADYGTVAVSANASFRDTNAAYVRTPTPPRWGWGPYLVRFSVSAEHYGRAAYASDKDAIYVRFSNKTLPEAFDVNWELVVDPQGAPSAQGIIHVTVGSTTPNTKELPGEFFSALAATFLRVSGAVADAHPFYAFAARRAAYISRSGSEMKRTRVTGADRDALTPQTGATSARDALQSDRAPRATRPGKPTIPIANVTPVGLKAHPWDTLGKALDVKPTIEPLASVVPAGMLYLHASSAEQLATTVAIATDRLVGIEQASGIDSGIGQAIERYSVQMGLERLPDLAASTDTPIDGIAIVSSDPLFRTGTDFSVVFHVTNSGLLEAGLAKKERDVAERFGARRSTYKIGVHDVKLTVSADGTVNRHQLEFDDVIIVSNSRAALERFVAVHDAKAPSIASGGDFTYMRALYPYDRAHEDAFCFMGDAFIAHVTSPAFLIAAQRRMRAIAETHAVNYAAMLYAWLEGRAPDSATELIDTRLIDKAWLVHSDGRAIGFDRNRGAYDKGDAAFAQPLLEHVVDKVTPAESDDYGSFRGQYEWRWGTYLNPVAVRITTSGAAMTIDARMLPFTTRGGFDDDIAEIAGSARVKAPSVRNGLAWSSAIGPETRLRRELAGPGKSFLGEDFELGWLGNWVMAGVSDRAGLYDLAIASGALGRSDSEDDPRSSYHYVPPMWRAALSHAPVFVGAEVNNPVTLAALLTAVHKLSDEAAPGLVEWAAEAPFDNQPVTAVRERTGDATEPPCVGESCPEGAATYIPEPITLHYTTYKGVLVASLDRATLDDQLTAIKEGRGPATASSVQKGTPSMAPSSDSAQVTFDYAVEDNGWLTTILNALADRARASADLRARVATDAIRPYLTGITDDSQRAAVATALLGYAPNKLDGAATTNLTKIRRVGARLSIEGNGDHRGLHTALTLE